MPDMLLTSKKLEQVLRDQASNLVNAADKITEGVDLEEVCESVIVTNSRIQTFVQRFMLQEEHGV